MLIVENREQRGAFTAANLQALSLIAGQLAVSLENARLYEHLEERVRAQTQELVVSAHRAGMAQVATNVLHNVGNVLNSVNVAARLMESSIRQSRVSRVGDVARKLELGAGEDERAFFDSREGALVVAYVRDLADELAAEQADLLGNLERLLTSVEHIKNVVAMQLSHAGTSGILERGSVPELVEDALRVQEDSLMRERVVIEREYSAVPRIELDRTRLMQVMVNLIANAAYAMRELKVEKRLRVEVRHEDRAITVSVRDNGCGIASEDMKRIFAHGFTTRDGGHGFGLHSSVVAAREMGAVLSAHSDGPGTGAVFVLRLPAAV